MAVNNSLGPDSEADSGWYVGGLYGARGRQEKCLNFYPRPGVVLCCDYMVQRYTRAYNNISTCKNDNRHFRTLMSISRYMKYQDSRRRKICNRLEGIWRDEFTISNFRRLRINDPFFVIPGEREISSILIASYTLSKRNEITGSPTHPPGHFDAAQNAFGVRVCARVWVQTVYLRTRGRAQDKEV